MGGCAPATKADTPKHVTNTSSERIDISPALLAFYDDLREKDDSTREEFSRFTAALREKLGKKFDPTRVPSVVQWFPSHQQFIAGGSLSSVESHGISTSLIPHAMPRRVCLHGC
jgi:hypothetical protein